MGKRIDFERLEQLFKEAYTLLYNNDKLENDFRRAGLVEMFDRVLTIQWVYDDVIAPFNRRRDDIISSDREAMAFLIAFEMAVVNPRTEEMWAKLYR